MIVEQLATLSDVDRREWDALAADDVFAAHGWLRTVEETRLAESRTLYFVIRGRSGLLAASVCYLQGPGASGIDSTLFGRFAAVARALGTAVGPALVCGPRAGLSRHVLVRGGCSNEEGRAATGRLVDAMERAAAANAVALCFRNVLEGVPPDGGEPLGEPLLVDELEGRGYLRAREMPTTCMRVEWPSFREYVRALKKSHPATAKGIARERNRARTAGVLFEKLDDVAPSHERLHDLLDSHHMRLNGSPFPFKPAFLPVLRSELGDRLVVYVAYEDGQPISVVLGFRAGDAMHLPMVGMDAGRQRETFVYFNNSYIAPIEDAIRSGVRTIYGGKLVYEIKVRRGFRLVPLNMYLRMPSRLRAVVLRPVARAQRARIGAMTNGLPSA